MNRLIGWGVLLVVTVMFLFSVFNTHLTHAKQNGAYIMEWLWATGAITAEVGANGLISTDLDQDGRDEIIGCNGSAFYVLKRLVNEEGYYTHYYSEQQGCHAISVYDREGDGFQEIFAVNSRAYGGPGMETVVYVYDGVDFTLKNTFTLTYYDYLNDVEVADVDGDGTGDIVVSFYQKTHIYDAITGILEWETDGTGSAGKIRFGNVHPDPGIEILVSNNPVHMLNATLQTATLIDTPILWDMDVGDVDGDGLDELVSGGAFIHWYSVDTGIRETLYDFYSSFRNVKVANLDNTAPLDIVVTDIKSDVMMGVTTEGTLLWTIPNTHTLETGETNSMAVGDTDNDGNDELIWTTEDAEDQLIVANLATHSIEWRAEQALQSPLYVGSGDLEGDGTTELIIISRNGRTVPLSTEIRVYDAATRTLKWVLPVGGEDFQHLYFGGVAQMDADPALEIVIAGSLGSGYTYSYVAMYDGSTRTEEWRSPIIQTGMNGQNPDIQVVLGNGDADPALEVAITEQNRQQLRVLDPTTNQTLWTVTHSTVDLITDFSFGDLDGNGSTEIALSTDDSVSIYEAGTFILRHTIPSPSYHTVQQVLITNRDGQGAGELLMLKSRGNTEDSYNILAHDGTNFELLWEQSIVLPPDREIEAAEMLSRDVDYDGDVEFMLVGEYSDEDYFDVNTLLWIAAQEDSGFVEEYVTSAKWGRITNLTFVDVDGDYTDELLFGGPATAMLIQVVAPGTAPTPTPTPSPTSSPSPTPVERILFLPLIQR